MESKTKHIKCRVCQRKFKSENALSAHSQMKHAGAGRRSTLRPPPKGVAIPTVVVGPQQQRIRRSGMDRMATITSLKNRPSGEILLELPISAQTGVSFREQARLFQKFRPRSLRITVAPQTPTTASGGYVVAFVADPADKYFSLGSPAEKLEYLSANTGSVTTNIYQSSEMPLQFQRKWYYCSPSEEIREYEVGTVVIMIDTPVSAEGGMSVVMHWDCEFWGQTVEGSDDSSGPVRLSKALTTRLGHAGLWWKDDTGGDKLSPALSRDLEVGKVYLLEHPFTTRIGNAEEIIWGISKKDNDDYYPVQGVVNKAGGFDFMQFSTALEHSNVVALAGEVLLPVETPARLNSQGPSSRLALVGRGSRRVPRCYYLTYSFHQGTLSKDSTNNSKSSSLSIISSEALSYGQDLQRLLEQAKSMQSR